MTRRSFLKVLLVGTLVPLDRITAPRPNHPIIDGRSKEGSWRLRGQRQWYFKPTGSIHTYEPAWR